MNTVKHLIDLIREYYKIDGNSVGGNLHTVIDDGNLKDKNIDFCIKCCTQSNDIKGLEICNIFKSLSKTQRKKVYLNCQ